MSKAPDAFRTISEVADWLGVQTHVLRFWESKFSQIKPVKRAGGRRYYRPSDMALLGGIKKLLHEDGMTIKGAQKVLKDQGVSAVSAMSRPLDGAPEAEPTPEPAPKVVPMRPEPKPSAQIEMFDQPDPVVDTDDAPVDAVDTVPAFLKAPSVEPVPEAAELAEPEAPVAEVNEPLAEVEATLPEQPEPVALPSADTPVLEALHQLKPGQVPALQLQAIHQQMVLLRARMDGAAAAG
ncbi:MerR family transcriptional regulator [Actibacterium sp. 188UL27-1]|uniref:MerR family transcriptional regulator n=1 Tax=Actibacterium sp. 188UL27-1 TaxID=2786961 RepID=UPI001EF4B791|nr:MerR family transcriptional regulator [Actibacterium sp. 188UL27-1]